MQGGHDTLSLSGRQRPIRAANPDLDVRTATDSSLIIKDSRDEVIRSLILGILFAGLVVLFSFGDLRNTLITVAGLPVCIIGAVLGLLLANKLFDMVAFIGLIMLMGLVTKNSILLIDYTNTLRKRGLKRFEAIIEAGSTRLRPILMTTLAMILGMIPVAAGLGTSSSFRAGIGYTIIGGLISSTVLTLVVVPVVYSILDDIVLKLRRKKAEN